MKSERSAIETLLSRYSDHEVLQCELTHCFAHHPDLTPACVEALASYICNQKCVVQEIVHPNGQIERLGSRGRDLAAWVG